MTEAAVREDGEAYPALYRATVHMYSKHATWCSKNGTRFSSFSHCVREQCAWTSARGQTHRPNGIRHRPRAAVHNRHTCSCWCAPGMTAGQRHGSRGQSPQRATLRHAGPPVHTHRGRVPCWWVLLLRVCSQWTGGGADTDGRGGTPLRAAERGCRAHSSSPARQARARARVIHCDLHRTWWQPVLRPMSTA